MQILIYVFASFLFFNHAYGEDQQMIYSATYSGTTITFDIRIFPNDDTVTAAAIANPTTGVIDTGTSTNACKYIASSSPVPLVSGIHLSDNYVEFEVVIDFTVLSSVTFDSVGNQNLGCTFSTVDLGTKQFSFYVRGLASLISTTATDREYLVQATGSSSTGVSEPGSTTFQGPSTSLQTAATTTTYTFAMTVVDSPAQADKTTLDLGETAQLKFTMTVNPYESKMDFAGARITNCVVDKVPGFNSPAITFIGLSGCFVDVDIFDNVHTNVGFVKDGASTVVGTTKTYIAYSPKFEMSAFTKNPINVANALYFKCDITLCLDDDAVTAGQCGAAHCDPTRRKRDVNERSDMSVTASVNITSHGAETGCNKCSETTTFKLSLGVLGTTTAIVFGFMVLSFTSTRHAAISLSQKHRKSKTGSSYCKDSSVSLSPSSITGSDDKSNGNSLPRKPRTS